MSHRLILSLLFLTSALASQASVRVEETPEHGLQPEVVVAADGTVHAVWLRGDPKSAEVRYAWRKPAGGWETPMTVNSAPGGAGIAIGTIRGPQLALGKGAVHVLWNGGSDATTHQAPLWHARKGMTEEKFGPQTDLLGKTTALDGGAALVADRAGKVSVVWHALPADTPPGEARRQVFVRTSSDDGLHFAPADPANAAAPGVCACCALRAAPGPDGGLNILFRDIREDGNRSATLLQGQAGQWTPREVDPWPVRACPMSSFSLLPSTSTSITTGPLAAWETAGQIRLGWLADPKAPSPLTLPAKNAKHPTLAVNKAGNILVAWVEGTGWNKGGQAHWAEFDKNLHSVAAKDATTPPNPVPVPVWGRVTVYAEPGGDFVLLR